MSEQYFTHYFKLNLANSILKFFEERKIPLKVKHEYTLPMSSYRVDIGIFREDLEDKLVGIEIEVISCKEQVIKNYNKFKNWVHGSPHRKGALLHILSSQSETFPKDIYPILIKSYEDMGKELGFYYEFLGMELNDRRMCEENANFLVYKDWEFDVRLLALISKVFGNRYIW